MKENKIELNKQKEKFEENKFNNDIEFYFNENNNNKLYGDIRNYNDYKLKISFIIYMVFNL